jgi:very-short-patch-repair endonuclease
MHKEQRLAALARGQHGVFTRAQALGSGFTEHEVQHRLRHDIWSIELPGVYALRSTPRSNESRMWAALLWAGEDALLSHRAAGHVWKYDDVRMLRPEVLVPAASSKRCSVVTVRRTRCLHRLDRRFVHGMAVTSPERTLLDLASVLDEYQLEVAFESARRERLVTIDSVQRCIERSGGHGRRGTAALRALLAQLGERPSESPLEVRAARLLRRSRLPRPVQQYEIGRYRLDFAWPEQLVALECDGKRRHSEDTDFQHDRTKLTDLATDGWRVLVATRADVNDALIEKLDRALTGGASLLVRPRGRRSTS